MKWSRWTGLLVAGLFAPATALACMPQETKEQAAAVAELPPIPDPHAQTADEKRQASPADGADASARDEAPAKTPDVAVQDEAPAETPDVAVQDEAPAEKPDVAAPGS